MDDRRLASAGAVAFSAALLLVGIVVLATPMDLLWGFFPTPLLPLVTIFLFVLDRPGCFPPWLSFAGGLTHDLLFGAAIGPWASVYLVLHAMVVWQRSYFAGRDATVLTTGFAVGSLIVCLLYWFEMSILSARTLPLLPLLWQWVATVAVFPPLLYVFRRTVGRPRPTLAG